MHLVRQTTGGEVTGDKEYVSERQIGWVDFHPVSAADAHESDMIWLDWRVQLHLPDWLHRPLLLQHLPCQCRVGGVLMCAYLVRDLPLRLLRRR